MRGAVEESIVVDRDGHKIRFGISLGLSEISDSDSAFDSGLMRADQVLYSTKNEGRNKVSASH